MEVRIRVVIFTYGKLASRFFFLIIPDETLVLGFTQVVVGKNALLASRAIWELMLAACEVSGCSALVRKFSAPVLKRGRASKSIAQSEVCRPASEENVQVIWAR